MEGITADDAFGLDILAISFGVYPRKSSILVLLFTFIIIAATKKIYPNDPCPCGSGKKYKKCCGRK